MFPNVSVLTHPLVQHKLTLLRRRSTATADFRQIAREISLLMAYEVTRDLPLENVPIETPAHRRHPLVFTHDKRKPHYGRLDQDTSFVQVTGGGNCSIRNARDAMGIDWMTRDQLAEAIPPAFTQFIGEQLSERMEMAA